MLLQLNERETGVEAPIFYSAKLFWWEVLKIQSVIQLAVHDGIINC